MRDEERATGHESLIFFIPQKESYMDDNKHNILIIGVSLLFFSFILILGISKFSSQLLPLIFVLVPIIFIITFVNTDIALSILIFSS